MFALYIKYNMCRHAMTYALLLTIIVFIYWTRQHIVLLIGYTLVEHLISMSIKQTNNLFADQEQDY